MLVILRFRTHVAVYALFSFDFELKVAFFDWYDFVPRSLVWTVSGTISY